MVARLRQGVPFVQAQQDVDRVSQEIMRAFPAAMSSLHVHTIVEPLEEATVAQARPLVRTLFLAVAGAKLALIGCGIGAVAAVFATRLLRSFLFQVDPLDPTTIMLAALSIFLLALAASLIPARRAASVEPIQALRAE